MPHLLLVALLCLGLLPGHAIAESSMNIATTPATINMGARYNGAKIEIKGSAPAGSAVIVRFVGEPSELHLRQKGKVFGLLWMNVGTIKLENVPKVCIIDTSVPFEKIGEAGAPYSLAGTVKEVEIEKDADTHGIDIANELLLLKKHGKLYSESEQGVIMGPEKDGLTDFSTQLNVPSSLAPGKYLIEAVAVKDGKVIADATDSITAEMVGFPAWLSHLAYQKSLLYGIMATVIALISGLVIGLVFGSKGGAH